MNIVPENRRIEYWAHSSCWPIYTFRNKFLLMRSDSSLQLCRVQCRVIYQIALGYINNPYYNPRFSNNLHMDYDKLCKDILSLAPDIRFAGVCDETGEIKYGGHREGVTNLLSLDETKRSNLQALARWGLRNSLASKIGRGKYAMAEYEKIKRITFPLENHHLLLITSEVGADHTMIIGGVLQLLKR